MLPDAIRRYEDATGIAAGIAKLEAEKETDTLHRIAQTPTEQNATTIIDRYLLAVSRAWLETRAIGRVQPETSKELITAGGEAMRAGF